MGRWLSLARNRDSQIREPTEPTKDASVGFVSVQNREYHDISEAIQEAQDLEAVHDICASIDTAVTAGEISRDEGEELLRLATERSAVIPASAQGVEALRSAKSWPKFAADALGPTPPGGQLPAQSGDRD
jgi:hypothetical protein